MTFYEESRKKSKNVSNTLVTKKANRSSPKNVISHKYTELNEISLQKDSEFIDASSE